MSTLSSPQRNSLCLFTFADGRRCRTPRAAANRNFCFYHAQKEARTAAANLLATDLSYFFSGDYLSACDLSSALARIIPAVVQGHVKPRVARTVACLFQTFVQAVRLSQYEYINSFGTDGWRQAVRGSVNANSSYLSDAHSASESPQTNLQPAAPPNASHSDGPERSRSERSRRQDSRRERSESSRRASVATSNTCHPERSEGSQRAPSKPAPHHTSNQRSASPPPSNAHPDIDPARADAALTIARSLFPPHSANVTSAPSRPVDKSIPSSADAATSTTLPASPKPREQASPSLSSPSPSPSAQSPTSTAPAAPPRRFGPPGFEGNIDPYTIRIDASLVRIDGKPI